MRRAISIRIYNFAYVLHRSAMLSMRNSSRYTQERIYVLAMVIALVDFSEIFICRRHLISAVCICALHAKARPYYAFAKTCWPMSREPWKKGNWKYSRAIRCLEGALSLKMSKHSRSRRHQCGRLINKHYQPRAHSLKTRIYESWDGTRRDKLPIFHACSSMSAAFVNT